MRTVFDLSSLAWTCLLVGKDKEGYEDVDDTGNVTWVNTHAYGYENAINSIVSTCSQLNSTPIKTIFVEEGLNSKARRLMISREYKAERGKRPMSQYTEFNKLKNQLKEALRSVGAIFLSQDNVESDDVIAWIAKHIEEDITIVSNDNDLSALQGTNAQGAKISTFIGGVLNTNKYGMFDAKHITVYKALVGDSSDSISGIKGFGPAAFIKFYKEFGDAGLDVLDGMGKLESLDSLALEAEQNSMIKRLFDNQDDFIKSYKLARMYPEWCNTLQDAIQWSPGLVLGTCCDERLRRWAAKTRLVTVDNYDQALGFLKSKLNETPWFSVDLETSVPDEADYWLEQRSKTGGGVDVISSKITGASITFGSNTQYAYYVSVGHADTANVSAHQLNELLHVLPADKITAAHNAAGFELPVMYNEGVHPKDNGWRGFFPNMVDTRIAASYWDENQFSHGLKQLTKLLFGYEQETYDEVTGGLKMNQIPATRVLQYGCDDVYTSSALWNFFSLFMQLEHTFKAFMEYEQKPMYLQALAYTQGIPLDMKRLSELSRADDAKEAELSTTINEFLVNCGWEGSVCPTIEKLDPTSIKLAVSIVLGEELKTMVRTTSKLATLVSVLEGGKILSDLILADDITSINRLMQSKFTASPELNTGSPKQMQEFLYTSLALPIRLRRKPTDAMRAKGIREGTPRTDEDAMNLAIKMGDVAPEVAPVLKSLISVKSIHTRRGLYWEPYPKLLHWKTGKLHPELRQSATNTRRYAGSNPNIQQLDSSKGGVRSVILPHHKNAIVASLDESAQEVRQMADYCQDENLLTCYLGTKEQLRDVHSIVACKIAGLSYDEFRKRYKEEEAKLNANESITPIYSVMRQRAKITLFATLYGAAAAKIAEGLGITEEEAQGYIDAIYDNFPKAKDWKEESESMARNYGYVPIHGGTVRHLAPLINSEDTYTASKALRQAGNARIQSAGGNQIKRVMSRIWDSRLIEDYDYRWMFSVHDETVHSIHKDHAAPVLKVLHSFMTEQFLLTVPSASSIGVGPNFGQLNELGETFDEDKIKGAVSGIFATNKSDKGMGLSELKAIGLAESLMAEPEVSSWPPMPAFLGSEIQQGQL